MLRLCTARGVFVGCVKDDVYEMMFSQKTSSHTHHLLHTRIFCHWCYVSFSLSAAQASRNTRGATSSGLWVEPASVSKVSKLVSVKRTSTISLSAGLGEGG